MTICYFGDFDPEYARNRVVIKGLKENKINVLICHTDKKKLSEKIRDLRRQFSELNDEFDMVIVGYSNSRAMVPLAWLWSSKPVIWDAFYSLYDAWVWDRQLVNPWSPKAAYYWLADWFSSVIADIILLDTSVHINYFRKTFGINKSRFIRVLVGSDESVFHPDPIPKKSDKFLIHFHGNYVPLQGVEYIIEAASRLKNEAINFRIIGSGQTHQKVMEQAQKLDLPNVEFLSRIPLDKLAAYMAEADVCLGIFGDTDKTRRVIPNKVYEAIAMAKPVISADTPAIRELFNDRENILLCRQADPADLADKIRMLYTDRDLCRKIAENGHQLFLRTATPAIIGKALINELQRSW